MILRKTSRGKNNIRRTVRGFKIVLCLYFYKADYYYFLTILLLCINYLGVK